MADLDVLKEIPGYKAILKSVLKSQIQLLLEQLSDQTGEESMILTASVHDGSLSHLGSCTGKGFLEGREEIKSQFLGYCLKTHHRAKDPEPRGSPYQRTPTGPRGLPQKKARLQSSYPVSSQSDPSNRFVSQSSPSMSYDTGGGSFQAASGFSRNDINYGMDSNNVDLQGQVLLTGADRNTSSSSQIKQEHVTTPTMAASTGVHHTQPLTEGQDLHQAQSLTEDQDNLQQSGAQGPDMNLDTVNIKMESVDESDLDLEITGVMVGVGTPESWGQRSGTIKEQGLEDNGDEAEYNYILPEDAQSDGLDLDDEDKQYSRTTGIGMSRTPIYKPSSKPASSSKVNNNVNNNNNHLSPLGRATCKDIYDTLVQKSKQDKMVNHGLGDYGFMSDVAGKPFGCVFCQKSFTYKADLKRHVRIHTGERPYTCRVCGRTFNQSTHLRLHQVRHFKESLTMFSQDNVPYPSSSSAEENVNVNQDC